MKVAITPWDGLKGDWQAGAVTIKCVLDICRTGFMRPDMEHDAAVFWSRDQSAP